jgi:hypothetical protein
MAPGAAGGEFAATGALTGGAAVTGATGAGGGGTGAGAAAAGAGAGAGEQAAIKTVLARGASSRKRRRVGCFTLTPGSVVEMPAVSHRSRFLWPWVGVDPILSPG